MSYSGAQLLILSSTQIKVNVDSFNAGYQKYVLDSIMVNVEGKLYNKIFMGVNSFNQFAVYYANTADINYISTPQELQNMSMNKINILTNDIDMTGFNWTPIGSSPQWPTYGQAFIGYFDGNGFAISNLSINQLVDTEVMMYYGLFGYLSNSYITNIKLKMFSWMSSILI